MNVFQKTMGRAKRDLYQITLDSCRYNKLIDEVHISKKKNPSVTERKGKIKCTYILPLQQREEKNK